MPTIVFHHADGEPDVLEVADRTTLMYAAVDSSVKGVIGECGGNLECATCHVYVREPFLAGLPDISDDEELMLEETTAERDPVRSRLGCQLAVGPALPRIEVDVPDGQD